MLKTEMIKMVLNPPLFLEDIYPNIIRKTGLQIQVTVRKLLHLAARVIVIYAKLYEYTLSRPT